MDFSEGPGGYGRGPWPGVVVEVDNPPYPGMVRCRVDQLGVPDRPFVTGWLRPNWQGLERVPPKGRGVWVQFTGFAQGAEDGSYSGEYPVSPKGFSEMTPTAQKPPQVPYSHGRGLFEAKTSSWSSVGGPAPATVAEPETFAQTVYPHNATRTWGNLLEEWDKSPGAQRWQRIVGYSYHEVSENGTSAERYGHRFTRIDGDDRTYVDGDRVKVIAGHRRESVEGGLALSVDGPAHLLFARLRGRVGSVRLTIDDTDEEGAVRGLRAVVLGDVELRAVGAAAVKGRMARVESAETTLVASAGDVHVQAMGLDPRSSGAVKLFGLRGVDARTPVPGALVLALAGQPDAALLSPVLATPAALAAILGHIHPLPSPTGPTGPSVELTAQSGSGLRLSLAARMG